MKFKFIKSIVLLIFISSVSYNVTQDPIKEFIGRYNRSITVLEIGQNCVKYSLDWVDNKIENIICVPLLLSNSEGLRDLALSKNYSNMIVLSPNNIEPEIFRTLSRCEHFDVVIIHSDIYKSLKIAWPNYLSKFYNLGDFVIFDIDTEDLGVYNQNSLMSSLKHTTKELGNYKNHKFLIHESNRKGLDIARWNKRFQSEHSPDNPRYRILSDFDKKLFVKPDKRELKWVDGINLSTFVMMRGIYPNDSIITQGIKKMASDMPYHNDLIIGNIIIQGHKLVPIDFEDNRRNAKMDKLLIRAYNVFNGDGRRLKDPVERMRIYSKKKM